MVNVGVLELEGTLFVLPAGLLANGPSAGGVLDTGVAACVGGATLGGAGAAGEHHGASTTVIGDAAGITGAGALGVELTDELAGVAGAGLPDEAAGPLGASTPTDDGAAAGAPPEGVLGMEAAGGAKVATAPGGVEGSDGVVGVAEGTLAAA